MSDDPNPTPAPSSCRLAVEVVFKEVVFKEVMATEHGKPREHHE